MNCRINIIGRKVWNDNENAHGMRPATVDITLLRDGEVFGTRTVRSTGSGRYRFMCLPLRKNSNEEYDYQLRETAVTGYTTAVVGNNVVNTLIEFTITGEKVWDDNNNAAGDRPTSVEISLLQNGNPFDSVNVPSPPNDQDTVIFSFDNVPFADDQGKPFVYTVDEAPVGNYEKTVDGFKITNKWVATPN